MSIIANIANELNAKAADMDADILSQQVKTVGEVGSYGSAAYSAVSDPYIASAQSIQNRYADNLFYVDPVYGFPGGGMITQVGQKRAAALGVSGTLSESTVYGIAQKVFNKDTAIESLNSDLNTAHQAAMDTFEADFGSLAEFNAELSA